MHGPEIRTEALRLVAAGINDCEIARRLGVARTTIRDWRRPRYFARFDRCPRCWHRLRPVSFCDLDYAELLGLYLGDGHISELARTQRLRICLDSRYATVVGDADALLRRCFPHNPVGRVYVHDGAEVVLHVYCGHLACLFPQHGPGKKHDRRIALEEWQQAIVDSAPWAFPAGLHPLGRLRLRQPHRALRVPELRLRQLLVGHPRPLRVDMPRAGPPAATLCPGDPAQPSGRCGPSSRPRWRQIVNA